jgi:cytochrome P450
MTTRLQFNPTSAEFRRDPYPVYARFRAEDPVHRNPLGAWLLTRYEDVSAVLRDPQYGAHDISANLRSKKRFFGDPGQIEPLADAIEQWLMLINPPDHTRLRKLVNRPFTPTAIKGLRPRVEALVAELIGKVRATGTIDLVNDLAEPLAVGMISHILGVPEEGQGQVLRWTDGISRVLDPLRSLEEYAEMNQVAGEFAEYFRELFRRRRAEPADDLISALIHAESDAEVTEKELLSVCMLLFASGEKTTVNLIGNGMLALLRHRDQLELLRAHPEVMDSAIQELLRYDSPVQLSTRVPKHEVSFGGKTIPAGSLLFVSLAAANRDSERFPDADRLDLRRGDNRHLAFSAGIHYCLGSALALLEGEVALGAVVNQLGELELEEDGVEWQKEIIFRGPRRLPVRFTQRSCA